MISARDRVSRPDVPTIVVAGAVCLAVLGALTVWAGRTYADRLGELRHTVEVQRSLGQVMNNLQAAETGQRGYLITGDRAYLGPYAQARVNLPQRMLGLQALVADDPEQVRAFQQLQPLIDAKFAELTRTIALQESGHTDAALALVRSNTGKRYMDDLRTRITAMIATETRLLAQHARTSQRLGMILAGLLAVIVFAALTTLSLWLVQARRDSETLQRAHNDLEEANRRLEREAAERGKVEDQVRQMQKMEAVGQLTGGIAHDFNNMLAIVIGNIELARRQLGDPARLEGYLKNAEDGSKRAAVLTRRLLAFSRQQPLDPQPLDMNKMVGGMSDLLLRSLGETIKIETVLSGGLWRAMADPGQVENAILNLAVNARDAMPDGGRVTIETANAHLDDAYAADHAETKAGQYVLICVTDTGQGMSPEVIARAFDPFFTTKEVGKGTGLGLSQIYGFAKQSGGHVKIYSELGKGTTVRMYLPRFYGAEAASAPSPVQVAPAGPPGSPEQIILVVEDEDSVRLVTVEALRDLGYTVLHAASGPEALERLDEIGAVSLLFTDVVMPGMTGRELADAAGQKRPGLKVLYTTGYTRNAVVHNGVIDPGVAFLQKPFSIDQLAAKVATVLAG